MDRVMEPEFDVRLGDRPVSADEDPFALFGEWFKAAEDAEPNDANAMSLATVDELGQPDVRIVLLKALDSRGFTFFTNFESAKGHQLLATRRAALCFHWKSLRRQVRVRGPIETVSDAEADAYFASRPRGSRIGAWASQQSRPLESRQALADRVAELETVYGEDDIPRPGHWSGFRVIPFAIEFWQDGAYRLHDRALFERAEPEDPWMLKRLNP
ncbi:Pyridoxamine 5'-phosphate oxidase [Fulvimarina manganoxydans]|uniref:Pyridoxine/pyridoxamine 5'-phosphate oxidase n=2 Tax=Fulvimarina manganoxydans TaxID=937218 RepID=A0A1W2EDF0_9HYPH|nr:Pyridoxamine 5'-phosphate oxidase [Fulvimarina manganoxydans]